MFLNLTPHDIVIEGYGNISSSGVARVTTKEIEETVRHCGIDFKVVIERKPSGILLPESYYNLPKDEPIWVLVSFMALEYLRDQGTENIRFVAPDTGPTAIRDEKGQITSVRRLIF